MKWKTLIVASLFFLGPLGAAAQQFYPEATTIYFDASTTVKNWVIMPTSTRTILGVSIFADTGNRTEIYCGNSQELVDNWGNAVMAFAPIQNVCHSAIRFVKAAQSGVAVNITYLNGYISTTTTPGGGSSTTTVSVSSAGPTFQEWLFVACVLLFFVSLLAWRKVLAPFLIRVE